MHIIIIGGGTAGLAIAQGLHNLQQVLGPSLQVLGSTLQVSCFEREPVATAPEQGYRVEINDDGCEALKTCLPASLYESFESLTEHGYQLTLANEQLQVLEDHIGHHVYRPVDRFFFRDLMQHGLGENLHIGKKFVKYEEHGGKVVACFDDGSRVEGDLLIGADGANSKVRSQLLPHAERVRTGVVTLICKTKYDPDLLPHPHGSVLKCPDGHGMFIASYLAPSQPSPYSHSPSNHSGSYVFFALSCHEDKFIHKEVHWSQLTQEQLRDECIQRAQTYHPKLRHLVEQGILGSYVCVDLKTSVRVDSWHTTRVTLAGDAIHSMTPFRGTGANTALRDAAVLVEAIKLSLSQPTEVPILKAISTYEQELRTRGFDMMDKSLQACLWVHDLVH